jgi:hypothetical protein
MKAPQLGSRAKFFAGRTILQENRCPLFVMHFARMKCLFYRRTDIASNLIDPGRRSLRQKHDRLAPDHTVSASAMAFPICIKDRWSARIAE